jgi:hypothetical protein
MKFSQQDNSAKNEDSIRGSLKSRLKTRILSLGSHPNMDLIAHYFDFITRHGCTGGPFADAAILQSKSREMPRTLDAVSFQLAFVERRTIVRANSTKSVDLAGRFHQEDGLALNLYSPGLAFCQLTYS